MPHETAASLLSRHTTTSAESLVSACRKLPADRLDWQPTEGINSARSALDQAIECAAINNWLVEAVAAQGDPQFTGEEYSQRIADVGTDPETVLNGVMDSANAVAAAISAASPEFLETSIPDPFSGTPTTWYEILILGYWNMTYHQGQVNYIHTLLGIE